MQPIRSAWSGQVLLRGTITISHSVGQYFEIQSIQFLSRIKQKWKALFVGGILFRFLHFRVVYSGNIGLHMNLVFKTKVCLKSL